MNRLDPLIANVLPATGAEIARKLNRPPQNIYRALKRLESEFAVIKDHQGVYTWKGSVPKLPAVFVNGEALPKWYYRLKELIDGLERVNPKTPEEMLEHIHEHEIDAIRYCIYFNILEEMNQS